MSEIQKNADARYHALFERLIQAMTDLGPFDLQRIYDTLAELCVLQHVSGA